MDRYKYKNICCEHLFLISIIIPNILSHVNTLRENNRTNILNICLLFHSGYGMITI